MKKRYTRKLAVIVWLSLIGLLPIMAQVATPIEIKSVEQLQEVLSSPRLKSDAVKEVKIVEEGIFVDSLLRVGAGSFRIFGGPLIRAKDYNNLIFSVEKGGDITIENTIDGANITANSRELIQIQEGGTLTLGDGGILQNNKGTGHALCIANYGTFNLNGGTITHNTGDNYNHVLFNMGIVNLNSGKIVDNECQGSVYTFSKGQIFLNSLGVRLNGTDAILFVENGSPINLTSSLQYEITIETLMDKDGVVAVGAGNYNLTESDLTKMSLKNSQYPNLTLALENNQIVISTSGGGETTSFDLQREIDNASGTFGTTTTITIPEKGITLSAPVTIDGKYVKITGGTIKADFSETRLLTLFELKSGYLTLENIILDGAKTATAENWCTFIRQSGGSCYLERGTVLTNARGHWDRYNGILVTGGYCYLNKGARIELNTYGMGGTVSVEGEGHFSISDGIMYANEDGNGSNIENGFGTIYIGKGGYVTFYSGEVSHDYVSIGVAGDLMYGTVANAKLFTDAIKMFKGGTITLGAALSDNVRLLFDDEVAEGDVIVKGMDSHQLTASDLEKFRLPEGFSLKWVADTFVLSRSSASSGISTVDELQAAIDAADAGTADNPTELTVSSKAIDFNKTVTIKGKHIKLKGDNVTYQNVITSNIRLFSVESKGSLTIENATLLGTKTGTNAFCSFIYVDFSSSVTLNKVTMQKSLSDYKTWTMLRINGSCTLKDCTISGNNGTCLLFIGASANCRIEGGKIQNNSCTDGQYVYSLITNLGTLEFVSGEYTANHAISISSEGTTTLRSPRIKNYLSTLIKDEGSAIMVFGSLNLYNTATIGDDFYMEKSNARRGCLKIHGALKSNIGLVCHSAEDGWVVAEGDGYTLTQADLQKFVLANALAKEYTLKQRNNTFMLVALAGKSYNVKTETCQNGKITADKATAVKDEMVTVTATPSPGYKLYSEKLCYNKVNKLYPTNKANVFTFKMPAADATLSAEFIPEEVNVSPVDTSKFDPDNDIIPDTGIGNLDSLIAILGGGPKDIIPKSDPVPDNELPDALQDEVREAESKGDDVIGSLQELIDILSRSAAGQEAEKKTYYELPVKVTLTFYLPVKASGGGLRSSETDKYYILNESQGKISRIVPAYNAEINALIFETNKLGTFTIMRSNSSTANEAVSAESLNISSFGKEIVIYNLPAGCPYAIYNLAGQLLDAGSSDGSPVRYCPPATGIYIVKVKERAQKVYVQ